MYFGFGRSLIGFVALGTLITASVLSRAVAIAAGLSVLVATLIACYVLGVVLPPLKRNNVSQMVLAIAFSLLVNISIYYIWSYRESLLGFNLFYIPSESMAPTLQPGDIVLVDSWAYRIKAPTVGDIAVFRMAPSKVVLVKRITGANESHFNAAGDNRRKSIAPDYLRQIEQSQLRGRVTAVLFNIKNDQHLRGLRSIDENGQ